jgi:ribosomal protein L37E
MSEQGEAKSANAGKEEEGTRVRCIGCGRFVAHEDHWNQCADCADEER